MARLDPKVESKDGEKSVSNVGPSIEEMGNRQPEDPAAHLGSSARSYSAKIRERRAKTSALKGKSPPLGHAPELDKEKMLEVARVGSGMLQPSFGDEEKEEQARVPIEPPSGGVGSAYEVNRTVSSADRPLSLKEAKDMENRPRAPQPMSEESIAAMAAIKEETENAPPQVGVTEEVKEDLDSAAKDIVDESAVEDRPMPFDFDSLNQARVQLLSEERRKRIEKKLKPLDIGDMIMKREVQQTIDIVPGKLSLTLRTFSQRENLWVLKYIFNYPGSTFYTQELLDTCKLVCGIVAINGALLPEHRKDVGLPTEDVDQESFEAKMFHLASFPIQFVADMSVQSLWFQNRVNRMFGLDALKNG